MTSPGECARGTVSPCPCRIHEPGPSCGAGLAGRRDSESEQCWGEVFRSLKDRGVNGVELVVSDAHGGIRAATKRHYQGAAWQRCRVHFKRELMRKVSYKRAVELMKDAAAVFTPQGTGPSA